MSLSKKYKCRTCLKTSSKIKLLSTLPPRNLKADKTYLELLEQLTQIKFDADKEVNMPQGICFICSKKVRESFSFISQIRKCYKILMKDSNVDELSMPEDRMGSEESEKPLIKKEDSFFEANIIECVDGGSSRHSSISDDSTQEPVANNSSPANNSSDTLIKVETEQSDVFPECIINEEILSEEKESINMENFSYDPLKYSLNEESVKVPIDVKALPQIRCEDCDSVFTKSVLLSRHRKDCHAPNRVKLRCPHCPAEFNRRHNMHTHINKFHETVSEIKSQQQPINVKETFACEYCQRSYHSKYKLIAHVKSKHEPETNPTKDKKPEKRFLCTLCGLAFNSESNLDIHYRRHTGERPFKCDLCDRAYPRLYEVQIHRRSHTGERPHKCSLCEKGFITSHKLKVHIRTHTNERPYKCTQCDKAFKQSKDLNIHKRSHTGEKPYKCGVCNSTFTQGNSLKLHQTKTKHVESVKTDDGQIADHSNNT